MKFLIDECLTIDLVSVAEQAGSERSTSRGLAAPAGKTGTSSGMRPAAICARHQQRR